MFLEHLKLVQPALLEEELKLAVMMSSHIASACILSGNFSIVKRFEALPTYDVIENCPAIHSALLGVRGESVEAVESDAATKVRGDFFALLGRS